MTLIKANLEEYMAFSADLQSHWPAYVSIMLKVHFYDPVCGMRLMNQCFPHAQLNVIAEVKV